MKELAFRVAHEEVVSLVQSGVEEFDEGEPQAGVSLLLEAQFLLADLIQQRLNNIVSAPPLSPFVDGCADEERRAATAAIS